MADQPGRDRSFQPTKSAEDCKNPVCDDAKDFTNVAKMFSQKSSTPKNVGPKTPCPLNKAQLGNHTWSFLHTTAAYYPNKPTNFDKTSMVNLIKNIGHFYPCKPCASDFRDDLEIFPPKEYVNSRVDLSKYFCMLHNRVSEKLGREEIFDCSIENLDKRWLKNDACDRS